MHPIDVDRSTGCHALRPPARRAPRAALAPAIAAFLLLGACGQTVQTTSGADWAHRTPAWAEASRRAPSMQPPPGQAASTQPRQATARSIDAMVLEAATTEPLLRFPARIGLARVEAGRLAAIPPEEAEPWLRLATDLGPAFGTFVPVSPLIAETTAASFPQGSVQGVVERIRLGAARQHLDAVLVYEVTQSGTDRLTPFSVLDLTVIGAILLPTRAVEGKAVANALLLDVRNGYPYGTASSAGSAESAAPAFGTGDARRSTADLARAEAVGKLASEVKTMATQLAASLAAKPDRVATR